MKNYNDYYNQTAESKLGHRCYIIVRKLCEIKERAVSMRQSLLSGGGLKKDAALIEKCEADILVIEKMLDGEYKRNGDDNE